MGQVDHLHRFDLNSSSLDRRYQPTVGASPRTTTRDSSRTPGGRGKRGGDRRDVSEKAGRILIRKPGRRCSFRRVRGRTRKGHPSGGRAAMAAGVVRRPCVPRFQSEAGFLCGSREPPDVDRQGVSHGSGTAELGSAADGGDPLPLSRPPASCPKFASGRGRLR